MTAAGRPPAALSPRWRAGGRNDNDTPINTRNPTPNPKQPTKTDSQNHLTTTKKLFNQTGPPQSNPRL